MDAGQTPRLAAEGGVEEGWGGSVVKDVNRHRVTFSSPKRVGL